MKAAEYISSGAIEACVMGLASIEDWQELLQMAAEYPDVKAEKERLEMELELQHLSHAHTPPPALKEKIFAQLALTNAQHETPVVDINVPQVEEPAGRPKVVPIVPTPKPVKWLQRALAIAAVLLMGSILLNFYFYSKSTTNKEQYEALLVQQNGLTAKNEALQSSFNKLRNPEMKVVVMNGTPTKKGSMATVYWDGTNKDVYLLVNNLPAPANNKQYQLWALVDGKPVDAGMVTDVAGSLMLKMKAIPNAQAFAITLEDVGGSPTPHLDQLFVIGNVSS